MQQEGRPCNAIRRDGTPCAGQALPSSAMCWAHDPANRERVRQARSAGGHAKSRAARAEKLMPAVLKPVVGYLLRALVDTRDGNLTPQQASAMAAVAGALTRVYSVGMLEERLLTLEAHQETPAGRRTA